MYVPTMLSYFVCFVFSITAKVNGLESMVYA